MRVIGTAGHVDHGKSALVKALTGINPDRLREEQERQMTIDLGFAWLTLPGGEQVGIIDVPGHRDFIENMLAGVGGIDAGLLVIAADEGVMPQTREHLAILDLLQIERGIVVLTKTDLIEDPEWLSLVREDVRSLLKNTVLAEAPTMAVSAHTGSGLSELTEAIESLLEDTPARRDIGQPRLSVDRAFTISGFGTVVTGTLVGGALSIGDEVEILPQGIRARIRGLQTHKEKIEKAVPGSRVAVNVTGVDVDELSRGDVVVLPDTHKSTKRIDVQFQHLDSSSHPVKHNQRVKLFVGAAQRLARVRLLGASELRPGEEGWLQLELDAPIVAARGDRYILRRPSPPATIGGGVVVDAHPERRHRRKDRAVIERMEHYLLGEPEDVLVQILRRLGPVGAQAILDHAGMDADELEQARSKALGSGRILVLNTGVEHGEIYVAQQTWRDLVERILAELNSYHSEKPLRSGMSVEELRSRLKLTPKIASAVFNGAEQNGLLETTGKLIREKGFVPELSVDQEQRAQQLLGKFERSPYSPPSVKETIDVLGEEVFQFLVGTRKLFQVSEDVVFRREDYLAMVAEIVELVKQNGTITVAEARDHFNTSRKYALALLEHLDAEGITIRDGDLRRPGPVQA